MSVSCKRAGCAEPARLKCPCGAAVYCSEACGALAWPAHHAQHAAHAGTDLGDELADAQRRAGEMDRAHRWALRLLMAREREERDAEHELIDARDRMEHALGYRDDDPRETSYDDAMMDGVEQDFARAQAAYADALQRLERQRDVAERARLRARRAQARLDALLALRRE